MTIEIVEQYLKLIKLSKKLDKYSRSKQIYLPANEPICSEKFIIKINSYLTNEINFLIQQEETATRQILNEKITK